MVSCSDLFVLRKRKRLNVSDLDYHHPDYSSHTHYSSSSPDDTCSFHSRCKKTGSLYLCCDFENE